MKAATQPEVHVIKTGTCPTLTGKARLTYNVGCTDKAEIHFRLHANTGGGFFNDDWVSLTAIQQILDKSPSDKPITSFTLYPLFKGKSANTPAFLLAVLKQEGLVQASTDKQRSYERCDPKGFMSGIKALMDSSGTAKAVPQKAATKKTPSKSTAKKKA